MSINFEVRNTLLPSLVSHSSLKSSRGILNNYLCSLGFKLPTIKNESFLLTFFILFLLSLPLSKTRVIFLHFLLKRDILSVNVFINFLNSVTSLIFPSYVSCHKGIPSLFVISKERLTCLNFLPSFECPNCIIF